VQGGGARGVKGAGVVSEGGTAGEPRAVAAAGASRGMDDLPKRVPSQRLQSQGRGAWVWVVCVCSCVCVRVRLCVRYFWEQLPKRNFRGGVYACPM